MCLLLESVIGCVTLLLIITAPPCTYLRYQLHNNVGLDLYTVSWLEKSMFKHLIHFSCAEYFQKSHITIQISEAICTRQRTTQDGGPTHCVPHSQAIWHLQFTLMCFGLWGGGVTKVHDNTEEENTNSSHMEAWQRLEPWAQRWR